MIAVANKKSSAITLLREINEQDKSADPADNASADEAKFLYSVLANAAERMKPQHHPDFDGEHCVNEDCGEPLPPGRVAAGRVYCVSCQEVREKRGMQQGKKAWEC